MMERDKEVVMSKPESGAKRRVINIDQMEKIILCGQKMSNVFYNIQQDKSVPETWRKFAEICQQEWDALRGSDVRSETDEQEGEQNDETDEQGTAGSAGADGETMRGQ